MRTPKEMQRLVKSRFESLGFHLSNEIVLVDDRRVDYGYPDKIYVRKCDLLTVRDYLLSAAFDGDVAWLHSTSSRLRMDQLW